MSDLPPVLEPEVMRIVPVCIVCGEGLGADADRVRCVACDTPHHGDCWRFNGQCAVYGCGMTRFEGMADGDMLPDELLIDDGEAGEESHLYRLSGGMSGVDVAHLGLIIVPLLWLPVAVEGGWLLAGNLLLVAFPLLLFLFQVRTLTQEAEGLRVGYLLWSRLVFWAEIRSFGSDPLLGYALRLQDGTQLSIPAEPGELRELEISVYRRIREVASRPGTC